MSLAPLKHASTAKMPNTNYLVGFSRLDHTERNFPLHSPVTLWLSSNFKAIKLQGH
jgi:hypothetical protein